jgi:hypothetical protein
VRDLEGEGEETGGVEVSGRSAGMGEGEGEGEGEGRGWRAKGVVGREDVDEKGDFEEV